MTSARVKEKPQSTAECACDPVTFYWSAAGMWQGLQKIDVQTLKGALHYKSPLKWTTSGVCVIIQPPYWGSRQRSSTNSCFPETTWKAGTSLLRTQTGSESSDTVEDVNTSCRYREKTCNCDMHWSSNATPHQEKTKNSGSKNLECMAEGRTPQC